MKLAIMQPYFLPYIGYFQLISTADTFVIYDDVNYIKGGWINRNFILANGTKQRLTLQLDGSSPNLLINEILIGNNKNKILKTIQQNYVKAPMFYKVFPLIEGMLQNDEQNLSKYIDNSLRQICNYIGITPNWLLSSELSKDTTLCGQEKILSICKELGANRYVNMPGGRALYDKKIFADSGIELSFLEPKAISYKQFAQHFEPNLSIIDLMMFNSKEDLLRLINNNYELA